MVHVTVTDETMARVINAVEQQGITIRKASEMYQIAICQDH